MSRRFAAVALSSVLSLGALATPAFAAGESSTSGDAGASAARIEKVCGHLDELKGVWQRAEQRYSEAHQRLVAAKTKATDAGHTKLADRIGKRIEHMESRAEKAKARHDKIVSRCSAD